MAPSKNPHAVALGRLGGSVSSEKKAQSSRENGKKGGRPVGKWKTMEWWEYQCPECEASNALPNPPFPATHDCRECGKCWNVQKMNAKGYVTLCKERVPA